MANDKVRLSQVVGVYGPGAMLDLPDRSVLVMGLDKWEMSGVGTFQTIEEPRLARLLHQRLSDDEDGRLSGDRPPEFRTPPIDPGDPAKIPRGIQATVFPRWFACDAVTGDRQNRRRMVRFGDLDPPKRLEHRGEDNKKRKASPIRFVCGCENGHLQDIDWRRIVHQGAANAGGTGAGPCREAMWLEESGTSADPRDTKVVCDCGATLSLEELFPQESRAVGRLGPCPGERPWIGEPDPKMCDADKGLRLLIRSATNTYFPQVARVISLPQSVDELTGRIESVRSEIQSCTSPAEVGMARRFNATVRANLEGYSDEDVFARLATLSETRIGADPAEDPKVAEFRLLASRAALIGTNAPDAHLHAETLKRAAWDPEGLPALAGIASVVAVHRLREVACLYGFTRFEPSALEADGLEDVGLAIRGAPLAQNPEWLPAVEQFGEGIFIEFDPDGLAAWLRRPAVLARAIALQDGLTAWLAERAAQGASVSENALRDRADPVFVMAHSLAHALMQEVALDCGYPASSIKERIYVMPRDPGAPIRAGILIYTATAGNQGTLGGLVEVTHRLARVLMAALGHQELCSSDPVCADHVPANASEDRTLHGAACHGCLLIAETSCEARNIFLDRALLVDTVGPSGAGFF